MRELGRLWQIDSFYVWHIAKKLFCFCDRILFLHCYLVPKKEVPVFEIFWQRFVATHVLKAYSPNFYMPRHFIHTINISCIHASNKWNITARHMRHSMGEILPRFPWTPITRSVSLLINACVIMFNCLRWYRIHYIIIYIMKRPSIDAWHWSSRENEQKKLVVHLWTLQWTTWIEDSLWFALVAIAWYTKCFGKTYDVLNSQI